MSVIDKSRLLLFTGGTVPVDGVAASELAAEAAAREALTAATAITLVNVGGTADAITANLPPSASPRP